MLKTRITDLFDIQYPIVQGGMVWMSGYKLASAVANCGGLGLIGAGSMTPDLLIYHLEKTKANTDKSYGVNVPLIHPQAKDMIETALSLGIKIFFTSAGSPKKFTPSIKDSGGIVFHVVSTPDLAKKCEDAGVDGVVAEGFEAGGHNGRDELTSMVLLPQVVDAVNIPVLGAGGFATGKHLAAALTLGADGIQIGSRLAITQESSGHQSFKEACVQAKSEDTFLTIKKAIPVRLLKNNLFYQLKEAEDRGADANELLTILGLGKSKLGMLDGDIENGELEIGQVVGMIKDIPTVSEVFIKLIKEYNEVIAKLKPLE